MSDNNFFIEKNFGVEALKKMQGQVAEALEAKGEVEKPALDPTDLNQMGDADLQRLKARVLAESNA